MSNSLELIEGFVSPPEPDAVLETIDTLDQS
jgi:hypothetical protein